MQIDFHHSIVYICARLAGFKHKEANIISYSSQYVDDATNSGIINFDNGVKYSRISSSLKKNDLNTDSYSCTEDNWIPFHFLPSNNNEESFIKDGKPFHTKLKCIPNCIVSKDMLKAAFSDRTKPYALHRLGIAINTYANTFAHEGFSGIAHESNKVKDLNIEKLNGRKDSRIQNWAKKAKELFSDSFDEEKKRFNDEIKLIGHSAVLSYPDLPFIKWSYKKDGENLRTERNNAKIMVEAARNIYKVLYTYKLNVPFDSVSFGKITSFKDEFDKIYENFIKFDSIRADDRHQRWLEYINNENFEFDMDGFTLTYKEKGRDSWKYKAIGDIKYIESGDELYTYSDDFLNSDWKLFHDALKAHKFDVVHDILPKYGICIV